MRIALADSFHIHDRNFPSLFRFFEEKDHEVSVLLGRDTDGFVYPCPASLPNSNSRPVPG